MGSHLFCLLAILVGASASNSAACSGRDSCDGLREEEGEETSLLQARTRGQANTTAELAANKTGFCWPKFSCPKYTAISTTKAQQLNVSKFQGVWWEVASRNIPIVTSTWSCTRYYWTLMSPTTFNNTLFAYDDGRFPWSSRREVTLPNEGSFDLTMPGKMYETFGSDSLEIPYWVLEYWGDYEYSVVYACVPLLGEFIYYYSRTSTVPKSQLETMHSYLKSVGICIDSVTEVPMKDCPPA